MTAPGLSTAWCDAVAPGVHILTPGCSDLIVVGGGGLLQDVRSWSTIPAHLLPARLGIVWGLPVITVGLGVGPIRRPWLRRLIGTVCSAMTLIQVRDTRSKETLIGCDRWMPSTRVGPMTSPPSGRQDLRRRRSCGPIGRYEGWSTAELR